MFDFLSGKKTKNEYEKEEPVHDILMHQSPDRRLLPHMPGKHRSGKSRRAISDEEVKKYPYLRRRGVPAPAGGAEVGQG